MTTDEGGVLKFFSHPAVGITGTFASVLGLLLAIYFYLASRVEPLLTAYVSPARTAIVTAGQASALSVAYKGQPIKSHVTAVQVAIWNDGKQVVRSNDVLEPVRIMLSAPILEASVQKASRPAVGLHVEGSTVTGGELGVSWKILEAGDGGVIQIVYAGDPSLPVRISGSIVGQKKIVVREPERLLPPNEQLAAWNRIGRLLTYATVASGFVMSLLMTIVLKIHGRIRKQFPIPIGFSVFFVILSLIVLLVGIMLMLTTPFGPPFGF